MKAGNILNAARAAGVSVSLKGDDLAVSSVREPDPVLINSLRRHKREIVHYLTAQAAEIDGIKVGRSAFWRDRFEECAAFVEYDQGLTRAEAEKNATESWIAEWLTRNPVCSAPGRCLICRNQDHPNDPLTPFGTENDGYAWMHFACWPAWDMSRRAEAIAVLTRCRDPC